MADLPAPPASGHLDTFEAAQYLRLSRRRLDRYRAEGDGPRFRKFGHKVVYTVADLEAWSVKQAYQSLYDPDYIEKKHRRARTKK